MEKTRRTIAIGKFKATCLSVLEQVRQTGESIVVTKRGEPIAEIIPPSPPERPQNWLGDLRGTAEIVGDIVSPASDPSDWDALR